MRIITIILTCLVICCETGEDWARDRAWSSMTDEQKMEAPIEMKARAVGMTVEEFDLISRVVEAESDRSSSLDGRILIALTILNRVESGSWPDTIEGVCTQNGQFSVVESGAIWSVGRTNLSDWAVIQAHVWQAEGDAPHVIYFNSVGYNNGSAYGYVDGNYFMEV